MPTIRCIKRKASKPQTIKIGNATVKIYRRERRAVTGDARTVFEVADFTGGTRKMRSFSDAQEARREAEKIAKQIARGEAHAAGFRNADAASFGRAVELLRPIGMALEVAAANYAKAFAILGGDKIVEAAAFYHRHRADKITPKTVAETVTELIAAKEARSKSSRYVADLRARLNRFAGDFGGNISMITGPDVQSWLDKLKLASRTVRNFRSAINTLFAFAESHGYVIKGSNPVADTEEISPVSGNDVEIYTPGEMLALLNAAPKSFLPVLAIGGFAGLRTAEIERLDWRDIDLAGGFIHVAAEKAKTRSRRLVPILWNLAQWFTPLTAQQGKVWTGTVKTLIEARAETAKTAGVPWKNNGLRHSFCSYRLADIQNAAQVSLEAGNSPQMVFRHYRELVKPDAAKAWFSLVPDNPVNVITLAAAR